VANKKPRQRDESPSDVIGRTFISLIRFSRKFAVGGLIVVFVTCCLLGASAHSAGQRWGIWGGVKLREVIPLLAANPLTTTHIIAFQMRCLCVPVCADLAADH